MTIFWWWCKRRGDQVGLKEGLLNRIIWTLVFSHLTGDEGEEDTANVGPTVLVN